MRLFQTILVAGVLSVIGSDHVHATEIHVSSVAALQTAVNGASSGDVIVLDNGIYLNNTIAIGTSNITVRAGTPGGVYLNGTNVIAISGNNVTFSGFQFTSGSIPGIVITVSGNNDTLTQLNFNSYSAQKYVNLQGQYDVISYCSFENKPTTAPIGNLIHIAPDATIPRYAKIRFCSFKNMPGAGGDNGNECIRISNGATSTYVCRTVVEYCYFENTGAGDSEVISVKCAQNVIRYNTMSNNLHGNFCFRFGDNNIAYGNFFLNSGGIRIKVANNIYCYNNYFLNCGDGNITAPVKYVYDNTAGVPHLGNLNIIYNTIIDGTAVEFDSHATGNTWANNILKKSSGSIFTGGSAGITWAGNMYQGTLGISIASGMTSTDPKLAPNSDGYYGLSATSPAIDAASASYPAVLDIAGVDDDPSLAFDISGQTRPSTVTLKDVGCDEYNATGAVINRPLKSTDVGASYLGGPSTGVAEHPSQQSQRAVPVGLKLYEAFPNPFNSETRCTFHLAAFGFVKLSIFDLLGHEMATLVDENKYPGSYTVQWNATRYPSGVYFCRIQSGTQVETKKLVLMK
jgi:hypothetical protein